MTNPSSRRHADQRRRGSRNRPKKSGACTMQAAHRHVSSGTPSGSVRAGVVPFSRTVIVVFSAVVGTAAPTRLAPARTQTPKPLPAYNESGT
jgi:hypothetical protein